MAHTYGRRIFRSWWIALAVIGVYPALTFAAPADSEETAAPTGGSCELEQQFKPMSEITVGLKLDLAEIPTDCSQGLFATPSRPTSKFVALTDFHWQPVNFFHQPLYFDDAPLERYGQSLCPHVQPAISGARFFLTIPAIPYKIGVDHTHDCVTTLGKYRAGSCAPCVKEVLPMGDLDGALLTAGTALVMVFCLP